MAARTMTSDRGEYDRDWNLSKHTGVLLFGAEQLLDLLANFAIGDLHVVLGVAVVPHEGEEAVVGDVELSMRSDLPNGVGLFTHKLHLAAGNVRNVHVVGGWAQFLELLAGEDVDGDKMNLGVTMLSSLGGGHVNDLAGTTLDHNVPVLAQGGALHRKGSGGTGIGAVEVVLMLMAETISQCSDSRLYCEEA